MSDFKPKQDVVQVEDTDREKDLMSITSSEENGGPSGKLYPILSCPSS